MNESKKVQAQARTVRPWLGWLATMACVLCCLAPRSARADEEKTYAGASCHPQVADQVFGNYGSSDQTHLFAAQNGGITNLDGAAATVNCPIVKSVANDGNLKSVKVYVDFGPVFATASCSLGVFTSTMQPAGILPSFTTLSVSGKRLQTISFGPTTTLPNPWATTWSYYELLCTVPPGASVRSYYVNESGNRSDSQKIYSPAGCTIAENGSCAAMHGDSVIETNADAACPANESVQFVCPVVTDNKANTAGMDLDLSFFLPGYTAAAVHHGQCTLYGTNANGTTRTSTTVDLSAQPGLPHGALTTSTLHVSGGGAWSKYFLSCDMEGLGDGRFISYRTTEHGTGEAASADSKGYSASLCSANPYSGSTTPGNPLAVVHHVYDGTIASYGAEDVWCPIIGDHVNTPNGVNAVRVNLNEGFNDDVTTCSVDAYNPPAIVAAGSLGRWSPFASTSVVAVPASKNGADYTLSLPAVGGGVTAPVYVLHCILSSGSFLRNYEVDEK